MNRYLAEFIGTFFLVFAGTGAVMSNHIFGGAVTHPGIALVFGLIVMTLIYALGDISGAHFNPAVTLGFYRLGLFPLTEVFPYIGSQIAGGIAASATLFAFFGNQANMGATLPAIGALAACAFEAILTFLLMFVILHVSEGAKEKGLMAGVAIGGTVCLDAMFAGPITGASMNPARSIGPALISGQFADLWVYIVGPILGALAACFTCRLLRGPNCCADDKPSCC